MPPWVSRATPADKMQRDRGKKARRPARRYRKLSLTSIANCELLCASLSDQLLITCSRSQANTLAVAERQQLETLRREKKTLTDALASVQDKIQQAETKRAKLQGEIDQLADRDEEVSCIVIMGAKRRD